MDKKVRYLEQHIPILNAEWFFRIMPVRSWYEYPENWMMIVAALLVSSLAAVIVRNNEDLRGMQVVLQSMLHTDALTGIPNRVGLFHELTQRINKKQPFTLYYMDLDNFKQINDAFGHNTGDVALKTFCSRMSRHLREKAILARLSGDEFALMWESGGDPQGEDRFWEAVRAEFSKPLRGPGGESFPLLFSTGKAIFPVDGNTPDALVSAADERMYACKRARHAGDRRRRSVDLGTEVRD